MVTTIMGAGITGLSTSYHCGHKNCIIYEKNPAHGGHAGSETRFGFTMDRGPHVSFTRDNYVESLFESNTDGAFDELEVIVKNFHKDRWIHHPAQYHLWELSDELRIQCEEEMIMLGKNLSEKAPQNYLQWLRSSYGPTFSQNFPELYTLKYWTTSAENLSLDWVGVRMQKLNQSQFLRGLTPGIVQSAHYITKARYPRSGGFQSFFEKLANGAQINANHHVTSINLREKMVLFADGSKHFFERLVSTLPLPEFVSLCPQATSAVLEAAEALDCSQLLLVDVFIPSTISLEGHWFYVYDIDKWSTRIHCLEKLSSKNVPEGWSCLQVEVYFSRHRPFPGNPGTICTAVVTELSEMGFYDKNLIFDNKILYQWRWCQHANIIFTQPRRQALEVIWDWLEHYGLEREAQDLEPMSDWAIPASPSKGTLAMAGRFAQWKYYWTDDCVLRGRSLAQR